jgi:ABC-type spermidine/putrescine transport system permease subunit I
VPSFGEFVIPALMGGSKKLFVGSLISHYFLTANDVQSGAAFTCVSGAFLLFAALMLNRYFGKKAGIIRGH